MFICRGTSCIHVMSLLPQTLFDISTLCPSEKAASLPLEERKKYAEKVVVSFWKAIGGDEDEIEGLSDDD